MAAVDFTKDVTGNGEFGDATNGINSEATNGNGTNEAVAKGADDNAAEDRKIFVGGLSWETREPQLKEYFEKFGEVESINLKLNPQTGRYGILKTIFDICRYLYLPKFLACDSVEKFKK